MIGVWWHWAPPIQVAARLDVCVDEEEEDVGGNIP